LPPFAFDDLPPLLMRHLPFRLTPHAALLDIETHHAVIVA